MKTIGLVGGLSPESTIEYYRQITHDYNQLMGGTEFPQMIIRSLNLAEISKFQRNNQWDSVADQILMAVNDLFNAGADFAAICANTPHNAWQKIMDRQPPIPILSIMEATAQAVKKAGLSTVGLLGTLPTMKNGSFEAFFRKYQIELVTPAYVDAEKVDRIIWRELVLGQITGESRAINLEILNRVIKRGVQGLILGCTELGLMIKPENVPVVVFDTATIHAQAILEYALND